MEEKTGWEMTLEVANDRASNDRPRLANMDITPEVTNDRASHSQPRLANRDIVTDKETDKLIDKDLVRRLIRIKAQNTSIFLG